MSELVLLDDKSSKYGVIGYQVVERKFEIPGPGGGTYLSKKYYCGYVIIDNRHPLYEMYYQDDKFPSFETPIPGGITCTRWQYSDVYEDVPSKWEIGFDTAHYGYENITEEEVLALTKALANELANIVKAEKKKEI